jgi:hypothetical protein
VSLHPVVADTRAAGGEKKQVPPLRRTLRLRSGSVSGRNDKVVFVMVQGVMVQFVVVQATLCNFFHLDGCGLRASFCLSKVTKVLIAKVAAVVPPARS